MRPILTDIRPRTLRIPGLKKTYRFLHVTDAHVILYDETETPARAAYAQPRVGAFARNGIPVIDRMQALAQQIQAMADTLDGVLLTGDILDFPSAPGLAYLQNWLQVLPVPYFFVLGNHDWAYFDDYQTPHAQAVHRPLFAPFCGGDTLVHKQRFGELTVVGVDNTMELYEDGAAEALARALDGEEHVLLLQHIPLYAETLHEDTVAYWGRDINIGGAGLCKNDNWRRVLALIEAPTSPVRALITGHLHFWHRDLLACGVPQFVTAHAADGSATLFTITA